ncbi:hypothetical protein JA1_001457 [Spathaspora sp. JA1]|nr:hypothetical protein JA1_001457 [Spathaspora sp. JA1]
MATTAAVAAANVSASDHNSGTITPEDLANLPSTLSNKLSLGKQRSNSTESTASSSSASTTSLHIKPMHEHQFAFANNSNNNSIIHPQPQHAQNSSSYRRVSVKHRHGSNTFNNNNCSTGVSTSTSTNSTTSSSPNFNMREQPKIHSKLYCEDMQLSNSKPSTREVLSKLSTDDLRSVKSHTELAETANGVRMLAKNLQRATIQLDVKTIMIVTKARDNSLIYLTREVVEWLFTKDKEITVFVDAKLQTSKRFNAPDIIEKQPKAGKLLKYWNKKLALKSPEIFDLVVTLGGDGTVLYISNLFQRVVPPVISFALGSLGFLTNFKFDEFRERMNHCIDSGVKANLRMRFTCRVHGNDGKLICEQQVLNELVVDRGPSPYVTQLEVYGDGSLLTVAQADGLIIATPTGSTAYSLSAGGSLVHPGVSAISVTPICPHTLSFRPILLPDGMFLKVKVPDTSRATAWASFDGKVRTELRKGFYVTIQASPFPFPTVTSSKTEYIDSVSRNLHWNVREQQKPFSSYLTPENQKRLERHDRSSLDNLYEPHDDQQEEEEVFDINYSDEENDKEEEQEHERESSDEDFAFIPPDNGTMTPVSSSYTNVDDRCCFAHPHARISLNGHRF